MKVAIRKHLGDFLAILTLFILAMGIAGYILSNQRLKFPVVEKRPFEIKAEMENAQAVQPGQGQTVRVAGVRIGDIGEVKLENGKAVVTLQIDDKYKGLIREDARGLLRSKTGLKDMFLELEPGEGKPLAKNGRIHIANTAQDVDPDEILSVLDRDTRDYLRLLVSGAGKGLDRGGGTDLREVFRRFGPIHRDIAKVTKAVARRRTNLQRLIHNYGLLVDELGKNDDDVARLVSQSRAVFNAFAREDQNISEAVRRLPGALHTTRTTLNKVGTLADVMGPALEDLRPAFRQLDVANHEVIPLVTQGEPIVRTQVRPFARISTPYLRDFGGAARDLAAGNPDLEKSFLGFNRFFNIGAYNPNGREALTGDLAKDRARKEGYLFNLAWIAQNTNSLFNTSDAVGPLRRLTIGGLSCSLLTAQGLPAPVTDILGTAKVCAK